MLGALQASRQRLHPGFDAVEGEKQLRERPTSALSRFAVTGERVPEAASARRRVQWILQQVAHEPTVRDGLLTRLEHQARSQTLRAEARALQRRTLEAELRGGGGRGVGGVGEGGERGDGSFFRLGVGGRPLATQTPQKHPATVVVGREQHRAVRLRYERAMAWAVVVKLLAASLPLFRSVRQHHLVTRPTPLGNWAAKILQRVWRGRQARDYVRKLQQARRLLAPHIGAIRLRLRINRKRRAVRTVRKFMEDFVLGVGAGGVRWIMVLRLFRQQVIKAQTLARSIAAVRRAQEVLAMNVWTRFVAVERCAVAVRAQAAGLLKAVEAFIERVSNFARTGNQVAVLAAHALATSSSPHSPHSSSSQSSSSQSSSSQSSSQAPSSQAPSSPSPHPPPPPSSQPQRRQSVSEVFGEEAQALLLGTAGLESALRDVSEAAQDARLGELVATMEAESDDAVARVPSSVDVNRVLKPVRDRATGMPTRYAAAVHGALDTVARAMQSKLVNVLAGPAQRGVLTAIADADRRRILTRFCMDRRKQTRAARADWVSRTMRVLRDASVRRQTSVSAEFDAMFAEQIRAREVALATAAIRLAKPKSFRAPLPAAPPSPASAPAKRPVVAVRQRRGSVSAPAMLGGIAAAVVNTYGRRLGDREDGVPLPARARENPGIPVVGQLRSAPSFHRLGPAALATKHLRDTIREEDAVRAELRSLCPITRVRIQLGVSSYLAIRHIAVALAIS
jgi:hypothetical protein